MIITIISSSSLVFAFLIHSRYDILWLKKLSSQFVLVLAELSAQFLVGPAVVTLP